MVLISMIPFYRIGAQDRRSKVDGRHCTCSIIGYPMIVLWRLYGWLSLNEVFPDQNGYNAGLM
jgi:hypothetical protein